MQPDPGVIDLWLIDLEGGDAVREKLLMHLSDDEQQRADRLRIQKARNHFIVARGALRTILGEYLRIAPKAISFVYGPHGKPELHHETPSDLRFNLSHSGDYGLLAVNRSSPIGVDIERERSDRNFLKLAERFFSAGEHYELSSLPMDAVMDGFYACWTRKEAYLKAIGTGLVTPLNAFDVSLQPGVRPALTGQRLNPSETDRWDLQDIEVPSGYRAAVATEWKAAGIIIRQWRPA